MYNFFRQNRSIILVAVSIFIVSMTSLLFFLNHEPAVTEELKTNVIDSFMLKSNQVKEKNYRELLQNHEDPIVVIGLDGTVDFASWDFEAATGFSPDEMKDELFFEYLHPEDLGTFLSAFGRVIESGEPVNLIGPFRLRDKSGEYHLNMASVAPVTDNDRVIKIGITIKDITNEVEKTANPQPKKKASGKTLPKVSAEESESPDPARHDPSWISGEKLVLLPESP